MTQPKLLTLAVAAFAAALALPDLAMAQTSQAAASNFCADSAVSLAIANYSRVEPAAGPVSSTPVSSTRASAILGGTMSKLEQMRSIQASGPSIAAAVTPHKTIISSECSRERAIFAAPGITATAVAKDAILGAQSVVIARTPFDSDWAAVQHPNVASIQNAVAKSGARSAMDKRQQVQMVNRWINHNVAFGDDQIVYGRADYWAPASETLRRRVGDCEDFAIAKMDMLAALGVARADMRLVIARDLVRNADHAVLIVQLDGGSVLLDNVTDRLLDGRAPNDYRPIMSFSQNAKWVHGYNVQQHNAQIRFAAYQKRLSQRLLQ
ncbi:MAG: transglutaminase-like cysteine peptidase [Sphingomonadaceae bacterium]